MVHLWVGEKKPNRNRFFCVYSKVSSRERERSRVCTVAEPLEQYAPLSTARPPLTLSLLGHRVEKSHTQ